jgi:hypothetical protein
MAKLTSTTIYGSANVYGNVIVSTSNTLNFNQGTGVFQVTGNTSIGGTVVGQNIHLAGGSNFEYWSQQFNYPYWSGSAGISANTANTSGTAAPDGTYTATKLTEQATSTNFFPLVSNAYGGTGYFTWSIFVKAAERTGCYLSFSSAQMAASVYFNLTNGTLVFYSNCYSPPTIVSAGNGWYRVSMTIYNGYNSNNNLYHFVTPTVSNSTTYAGTVGYGIYVWGAQLEPGFAASPYTITTSSQVGSNNNLFVPTGSVYIGSNVQSTNTTSGALQVVGGAGITGNTYVGGTDSVANTIIRGSGTNFISTSANIAGITNIGVGTTFTANSTQAPDNTQTAVQISEDTSTGQHWVSFNSSLVPNTTYTASIFVKAGTRNQVLFAMSDNTSGNAYVAANIGVVPSVTTSGIGGIGVGQWTNIFASIIPAGPAGTAQSNWYRLTLTATKNTGTAISLQLFGLNNNSTSYTGSASNNIYAWGPQVEYGITVSPYNPTNGSGIYNPPQLSFAGGTSTITMAQNTSLMITGNLFMSASNNYTSGNQSYRLGWPDNYFWRSAQFNGLYFDGTFLSINTGNLYLENGSNFYVRSTNGIINDSGNKAVLINSNSTLNVANITASTSNTTGALTVYGGVGVAGNIYSGGVINTTTSSVANFLELQDGSTVRYAFSRDAGSGSIVYINSGVFAIDINHNFGTGQYIDFRHQSLSTLRVYNSSGSHVNYLSVYPALTNISPSLAATGSDTNIALTLSAKGTGPIIANTSSGLYSNTAVYTNSLYYANGSPWVMGGGGGGSSVSTYSTTIGDGTNTTYRVLHNLAKTNIITTIRESTSGNVVYPSLVYANNNQMNVTFVSAPSSGFYTVSIVGF